MMQAISLRPHSRSRVGGVRHRGAAGGPGPAPLPVIAIVGATVVNLDGSSMSDAVVIIEGDRITAVGRRASTPVPSGAEVIPANGKFLVPGLMNMHVHLGLVLPGRQGLELANETDAALALRMAANAVPRFSPASRPFG